MTVGIFVALTAGIFLGDLWIKNRIEKMQEENLPIRFAGNRLILKRYHNTGAMLNLGASKKAAVTVISVVLTALLSIVFLVSLGRRGNNTLRVGLAFFLGGSFSNTYDRLKRKYVVDYLSFDVKWKRFRRIVFNFSDFCIIIGSLLTVLGLSK